MIARTAHARNFAHLALYLESDRADPDRTRVAWWSRHNLPSSSLQAAARWMERTAERNRFVQRPAYHLFVSVSPRDDAGHPRMRAVAEGLLRRLGLHEHQAVAVGHEDRAHPHLHIAVNRVHPVSLRAWDTTRDWPRIERALRGLEAEMGFRTTPGRLAPTPDGRWCDDARAMSVGARRFELREAEKARLAAGAGTLYVPRPSFLRHARETIGRDVLAAEGWAQLEDVAARRGLRLLQTDRGLVVTDGDRYAAIGRVASGASLHRLTRDFGEDYEGYLARTRGRGRDAAPAGAPAAGAQPGSGGPAGGADRESAAGAYARRFDGPPRPGDAAPVRVGAERGGMGGGGGAPGPAPAGGGHGELGGGRRHADAADRGRGGAPGGDQRAGGGGAGGDGRGDRRHRHVPHGGVGHAAADAPGNRGGAGRVAARDGDGAGEDARGEHPGSREPHRGGAPRARALGGPAEARDALARDPARERDGDPDPARRPPPLPVLGDGAGGRGGVEPRNAAPRELSGELAGRAAGDPPRPGVEDPAGHAAAPAFHVERAPGGWAVVHPASSRRWTLAGEEAARRYADLGSRARTPERLERTFRRLDTEAARASHADLVAKNAAGDLLDAAAAHCFVDPVAAADAVRWDHLRRRVRELREKLAAGPAAFGALRIERDAPLLWAALPEPRHHHLAAWVRFRDAARLWLEVQEGGRWVAPAAFPPPPEPPAAAVSPDFGPASSPVPRPPAPALPPGQPEGRPRPSPPGLDL